MNHYIHAILGTALLCCLLVSCSKESGPMEAPPTPPVESIIVDFSDFYGKEVSMNSNTSLAFVKTDVIGPWNMLFNTKLSVPVKGYKLALLSEPTRQDDGTWVWSANYSEDGNMYQVFLIGKSGRKKINWRLEVAADIFDGGKNFLWITGWSGKDMNSGAWDIVVGHDDTDTICSMEWKASAGSVTNLKVTYELQHPAFGIDPLFYSSTMEYIASASEEPYTSSLKFHFFNGEPVFWDAEIEWNKTTHQGRVKSSSKFKDTEWHCWG